MASPRLRLRAPPLRDERVHRRPRIGSGASPPPLHCSRQIRCLSHAHATTVAHRVARPPLSLVGSNGRRRQVAKPLQPDLSKTSFSATDTGQDEVEALTLCVEEELGHRHQPGVRGEGLWRTRCQAEERGVASG